MALPPGGGGEANVESFIEDHKTRADNDPSAPPFDDLRNYAYEGGGSTAGSLSSLGSGTTAKSQTEMAIISALKQRESMAQKMSETYKSAATTESEKPSLPKQPDNLEMQTKRSGSLSDNRVMDDSMS